MSDNASLPTFSQQIKNGNIVIALYFIQLSLLAIATIFLFDLLLLLKRFAVFHTNLRILLANFAVACVIVSFAQIIAIIQQLELFFDNTPGALQDLPFCSAMKIITASAAVVQECSVAVLVVERLIATVRMKFYERINRNTLGWAVIGGQWTMALAVALLALIPLVDQGPLNGEKVLSCDQVFTDPISTLRILIGFSVIDICSLTALIVLLSFNKKKYEQSMHTVSQHSLSERYQISENIKASRCLRIYLLIHNVLSLSGVGILVYMGLSLSGDTATVEEIGSLWIFGALDNFLISTKAVLFPLLTIFGHPTLKMEVKRAFVCANNRVSVNEPRNVNGSLLIIDQSAERNAHFNILDHAWNSKSQ